MERFCLFLARVGAPTPPLPDMNLGKTTKFEKEAQHLIQDLWFPLTALVVVVGGLFLWAFFLRKRHHPDPHVRSRELSSNLTSLLFPNDAEGHHQHRHHRRKGRRRHRRRHRRSRKERRNPSLQDTGGLPPLRPEGEPPPAAI